MIGLAKLTYLLNSWYLLAADLMCEFGRKFGDTAATVGEPFKIAVQFSGKPKKVQWFLRGQEIDSAGRFQVYTAWSALAASHKDISYVD